MKKIITPMLPFLFILSIFSLYLILPDKTFSIEERRYLAQWPDFQIQDMLNGSYGTKIESYFSDQVPFRDVWMYIQERSHLILGAPL